MSRQDPEYRAALAEFWRAADAYDIAGAPPTGPLLDAYNAAGARLHNAASHHCDTDEQTPVNPLPTLPVGSDADTPGQARRDDLR